MSDDLKAPYSHDRRQMLFTSARNLAGVAIVASTAIVARTRPAEAQECPSTRPNCNCFLKGTLISTPSGAKRIDELSVGDLVTTIDGSARPVQFISVNSYKKSDPTKAWVADARPVLVRKSAISENVPNRDLYLTRYHSLYLDGVLIPVHNLINGSTIVIDPVEHLSELEYFHIKLESHDVVLAEGTPCETLLTVSESAKNFADYYRAYGFPKAEQPYAPLHSYNGGRSEIGSRFRSAMSIVKEIRRPLDIVRDRLEARAASLV
jgi:Hint domain